MFGGDDEDAEVEEDLEPLEVVCYNIRPIVKAKN